MLSIVFSWVYMLILAYIYGFFCLRTIVGKKGYRVRYLDSYLWAGWIFFTAYGLIFSFFGGLGLAANVILLLGAAVIVCFVRKELWEKLREGIRKLGKGKLIVLGLCFLALAYFSSRGYEHYDTILYHGQAIHWLEEYGTVIGLGNVYQRFAYNSTAFVLTALFSFSYIAGQSLHTCAGFMVLLLAFTVISGWKSVRGRRLMASDLIRVVSLYYVTMVLNQIVSPASDYFAMVTVFYIVLQFVVLLEEKEKSAYPFGLLCVAVCFAVTLKTSAAPLVLLTVVPAVMLIRARDGKGIARFLALGCLVVVPFFARGVVVSGYLMYPSTLLDVFDVDWKMDAEILEQDTAEISAWGKGIEHESRWDMGIDEWFPIWLSRQKSAMEKLLVLMDFPIIILMLVGIVYQILRKRKCWEWWVVELTLIVCFGFWFLMAPLIRYGWCFILLLPAVSGGLILEKIPWKSLHRLGLALILLVGLYKGIKVWEIGWDYRSLPYYIRQQDYSQVEVVEKELQGVLLYQPENGLWGYHSFPMVQDVDKITLRGETLDDGFRAAE